MRFRRPGLNERLEKIEALIDWLPVAALPKPLDPPRRGAPGHAALALFKAVLLAQWNGLSGEAMEEMLAAAGLAEALFTEVNRQLDAKGLVPRKGTLVDATLIAAQAAPPKPPKQVATAPQGQAAQPAPAARRRPSQPVKSPLDPDAGWTRRGASLHFGYKGHIGVDQGSGLIHAQVFTSAEVNDTPMADSLKLIGGIGGRVETVFGFLKRNSWLARARYFNKARNAVAFAPPCTAYNPFKANRSAWEASPSQPTIPARHRARNHQPAQPQRGRHRPNRNPQFRKLPARGEVGSTFSQFGPK